MTTQTQHIRSASRSTMVGLFAVVMIVIASATTALFFGFGSPASAEAQFVPAPIVITAPIATPPPIIPIIVPIIPVVTPAVYVPPAQTPAPIVVVGTVGSKDTAQPTSDTITYTAPCCTLPPSTAVNGSTPEQIVVVGSTVDTDTVTYTAPCCTVPATIAPVVPPTIAPIDVPETIPPVIIPPVIIPPVVPPVLPAPQCTLIAGPTSVQVGNSSVLTWTTAQATSFSINQNIGAVTPLAGGTITVTPGTTTTYTGTATGPGGTVTCNATVTVTTVAPVPACVLTASTDSVVSGTEVTLSYSGTNIASVSIDQGVGAQASTSGSVVVTPTTTTTYTGTFTPTDGSAALTCTAPVTVTTSGGGGGGGGSSSGGGGGGSSSSHSSGTSLYSRAIEAPLGAVYLSQIPYTGLDLGTVGTFMYWFMLIVWSLAVAYLVLFGILPFMRRRLATFGASVKSSLNEEVYVPEPHAHVHAVVMPAVAHEVQHTAPVVQEAPTVPARVVSDGFKSFATGGTLTIDDIVKGLSRESGMVFTTGEPVEEHEEEYVEEEVVAVPAPAPATEVVPEAVATTHPDVPAFISALLAGQRDEVFGIIRAMNQTGHDIETFMTHAICALDDAYRARIDGTPVHEEVKMITDSLETPFLEKLVTSLTPAIDGSYSTGVTGVKLALTRALTLSKD